MFVYTGARLAAGLIDFEQVGPLLPAERLIAQKYDRPQRHGTTLMGIVPVLEVQYANVWDHIPKPLFDELKPPLGAPVHVPIRHQGKAIDEVHLPY